MADPVVIVSAARTPIGGFQGDFASLAAPQLGAVAIRAAVERAGEDRLDRAGQRQLRPCSTKGSGATGGDAGLIRHTDYETAFAVQINHIAVPSLMASRAMMISSSVGMMRSFTRLLAVLMQRRPASLAFGSSSVPSQASRAATRARIPG